LVSLSA